VTKLIEILLGTIVKISILAGVKKANLLSFLNNLQCAASLYAIYIISFTSEVKRIFSTVGG